MFPISRCSTTHLRTNASPERKARLTKKEPTGRAPRLVLVSPFLFSLFLTCGPAWAEIEPPAQLSLEKPAEGQPRVVLDQLTFPKDVLDANRFEQHLRRVLEREARLVDWGAGRENRIEYRFAVTELRFTVQKDAFVVHCSATGKLPGGRSAKSQLSFGGGLGERASLTKQVLAIVARGVMTRLSELERKRRGLQ